MGKDKKSPKSKAEIITAINGKVVSHETKTIDNVWHSIDELSPKEIEQYYKMMVKLYPDNEEFKQKLEEINNLKKEEAKKVDGKEKAKEGDIVGRVKTFSYVNGKLVSTEESDVKAHYLTKEEHSQLIKSLVKHGYLKPEDKKRIIENRKNESQNNESKLAYPYNTVESAKYVDGKLVSSSTKVLKEDLKTEEEFFGTENLGIGHIDPFYINVNDIQDAGDEYKKIQKFLSKYIDKYSKENEIIRKDLKTEFINYGKTELVYVLKNNNENLSTILVKQPAVSFGKVKQEANYLTELSKNYKNIVAPTDYYSYGDQELFTTPYLNQARCVASYGGSWGMYVPEPFYRFEPFSQSQEKVVNTCMIAKLVSLYDFDKKQGICNCKLGGGDFMLPKGWENETPTIENTLDNLYLIAARDKIDINFEDYLNVIRAEFSRVTIDEEQENLTINLRNRASMDEKEIEAGIRLGELLIQKNSSEDNSNEFLENDINKSLDE